MEPNKDQIKNIFSSKLSGFEPEVPLDMWKRIEDKLEMSTSSPFVPNSTNRRKNYLKIWGSIAGAAAAILLFIYLYPNAITTYSQNITSSNNISIKEFQKQYPQQQKKIFNPLAELNKEEVLNKNTAASGLLNSKNRIKNITNTADTLGSYLSDLSLKNKDIDTFFEQNVNIYSEKTSEKQVEEKDLSKKNDNISKHDNAVKIMEAEKNYLDNLLADNTPVSNGVVHSSSKVEFGFQGGSGFVKSNDTKNQLDAAMSAGDVNGVVLLRESKLKMKHNQPIVFGLSVSKKISNKLSLETGIVYTYLSSRFKTDDMANVKQQDMQYLHYLGVPLILNYNFAEWRKVKFYASVGGLVQKDFYGRKSGNTYVDGVMQSDYYYKEKISQKHAQFSVNSGIGASYPLYDKLKVYTNFGTAYYIDAKNQYETIYSDKKWLFNLNLGIRFEF